MKIFYTASFYGRGKYLHYYTLVLKAIERTGVNVISPEKGGYKEVLTPAQKKKLRDEKRIHSEAIRKGILMSDAVIIEASHEDFQLGYEAAFAVQNKKPVLCLSTHENFGEKMKFRYFMGAKYNEYNVEELLENFINMLKKDQFSERFNAFLSKTQLKYIKDKAKTINMNASEYIRSLIDEDRMT